MREGARFAIDGLKWAGLRPWERGRPARRAALARSLPESGLARFHFRPTRAFRHNGNPAKMNVDKRLPLEDKLVKS